MAVYLVRPDLPPQAMIQKGGDTSYLVFKRMVSRADS